MHTLLQRCVSLALALIILLSIGFGLGSAQPTELKNPIFFPLIVKDYPHTITGQVVTEDRIPVSGVEIITSDGQRTITDASGNYLLTGLTETEYTLIPSKDGYAFSPASTRVDLPPDVTQVNFLSSLVACTDVVLNGGFENSTGWELPATAYTAAYSTALAHQGVRSLRTGIVSAADNRYSYSSGRQSITIPSGTISANLIFYLYAQSTEAARPSMPDLPLKEAFGESVLAGDVQYVLITDLAGNILEKLIWQHSNSSTWQGYSFDVTRYAGRTIQIHLGTYNDGYSGITSMYVDDVVLQLCPSTVPTPTPNPAACGNLILNDSFETTSSWEIPYTAYSAGYSTIRARSGSRSMRTGITDLSANKYSYSDAGQWIYIPWNAQIATLGMWIYPISGEAVSAPLPAIPAETHFGNRPLGSDVQYILVLDQYQNIAETLQWQRNNSQAWTYLEFNLKKYAGRTVKIQFGTYNDGYGGITSMFVDDVTLTNCGSVPTPTSSVPTPTSTATQVPANTPTPTPIPVCSEGLLNGGLETTSTWYIPLTTYPAAYSTERAYTGLRSMRTGITLPGANIYSYSDARQTLTIPLNVASVKLSLFAYTYSGESPSLPVPDLPTSSSFGEEPLSNDVQYLLVLNQYETWIDTLLWQRNNNQMWVGYNFDLKKYAGQTISLQFGTYNNGYGGITYMYFDDVSVQICAP